MTESFWESQPAADAQPVAELEPEVAAGEIAPEVLGDPQALSVSVDDFASLEQRIVRTVALLKQERQARAAAEARADEAEAHLREQAVAIEQLHPELTALRAEREQVRQRVERLLQQLDALEL